MSGIKYECSWRKTKSKGWDRTRVESVEANFLKEKEKKGKLQGTALY
jgi:hypothetical protein